MATTAKDGSRAGSAPLTVVVVGNGMVGHRFCECLADRDTKNRYRIVTFSEESRVAYARVQRTSFFTHRDTGKLALTSRDWYADQGMTIYTGDRVTALDRTRRMIRYHRDAEPGPVSWEEAFSYLARRIHGSALRPAAG